MGIKSISMAFALIYTLSGCATDNVISQEEIEVQDRADNVVSGVLFEYELDSYASYNIRKNGFVVISFDESVPPGKYTEVVHLLRSSSNIKGVRAEVSGAEVCSIIAR